MARTNVLVLVALVAAMTIVEAAKPHILLVVMDDLGWQDVSFHNGTGFQTPNIDRFATSGIILENYYVQEVCSPTRSALMTGRYPFSTGLQHWTTIMPGSPSHLPFDSPTIAELLKEQGYSTHMIGKWHLGSSNWSHTPTARGFDTYVGYMQGQIDYYNKTVANNFDFWKGRDVFYQHNDSYTYLPYMQELERVVTEADGSTPLFVYMAHQLVHLPLEQPVGAQYMDSCKHIENAGRRLYCAMTLCLDDAIGDTITLFEKHGLYNDTLVIYTTDNGGMPHWQENFPSSYGSNYPFRAGKTSLYEGGVRGVAFVNGGSNVFPDGARGRVNSDLWHAVDWYSTIASAAGATIPPLVQNSSHDLAPTLFHAAPGPRKEVPINLAADGDQLSAIRVGDWKLIRGKAVTLYDGWFPLPPAPREPPPVHVGQYRLFNLKDDPTEHHDLHFQNEAKVKELEERLAFYESIYVPPQPNKPVCQATNGVWAPCFG